MKNTRLSIILPLVISASVIAGIIIGMIAGRVSIDNRLKNMAREISLPGNKLDYALALIESNYIDPVNTDSLIEKLMPDLMWNLDPHSVYIPASEMTAVNEPLDGEFDGIGIVFNMATDTIVVLNTIPQGPSQRAGVQNGDRIIMIGKDTVAGRGIRSDSIMKMLRGKRGTTVDLSVKRNGIADLVPITVTRDKIPVKSVDAAYMLTDETAFMRITTFSQHTYDEMAAALERLSGEGMKKLIIDLRGNSGGYLGQPILMANEFLPDGRLIVYTEDRNGKQIKEYSDGSGRYQDIELAVLIDEHSASSSEILAGALQDNDRATIIGRRSYGKGLVQQQIPFADGSAMRLTTARYYTPTGRSIQKPYTSADENYGEDIYNRYVHNEFFSADSIRFDDSLKYVTPGGKVVYGGGGIMPDIFVPLDTTDITHYYIEVASRNILYRYTMEYADKHRNAINSVKTVDDLRRLLDADDDMLEDFVEYARRNGVQPDREQIEKSGKLITSLLRAYIGRNTPLEEAGFYSNSYVVDPPVLKALEIFSRPATKPTPTVQDTSTKQTGKD